MDMDLYIKMGALQGELTRTRETLLRIIDEVAAGHEVSRLREEMQWALMDLWDAHNEVKGKLTIDKIYLKPQFEIAPKSREEHTLFSRAVHVVPELLEAASALKTIENSVSGQMLAYATAPPLLQTRLLPLVPRSDLTLYSKSVQEKIASYINRLTRHAHGVVRLTSIYTGGYLCGIRMHIPKVFAAVAMFEQFTYGQGWPVIGPVTITGEDYFNKAHPATPTNIPIYREITLCAERARDFFTLMVPENALKRFLVWLSKYDDLLFRPCKRCKKLFDSESVEESHMYPIIRHPLTYEAFHKSCVPADTFDGTLPLLDPKMFEEPLFPDEKEEEKRRRKEGGEKGGEEKEGNDGNEGNDENGIENEGEMNSGSDTTGELALKKVKLDN